MNKKGLPSREELETIYNPAASRAATEYARKQGGIVPKKGLVVKLKPFKVPGNKISKSNVFAANVTLSSQPDRSLSLPSTVLIKHYNNDQERTSGSETDKTEFNQEAAILNADIKTRTPWGSEEQRVYPQSYSNGDPECREKQIIIREYIPGKTLEDLSVLLKRTNKLKWGAPFGEPDISSFIGAIAIHHTKSQEILDSLRNAGILKFKKMQDISPKTIAHTKAQRAKTYFQKLIKGQGGEVKNSIAIARAFHELDREYVSKRNLIVMVNGELDVFHHHAMIDKYPRMPDPGGVEPGGFIRDLAVYGAPCFNELWIDPISLGVKTVNTYTNVRRQLEDHIGLRNLEDSLREISKEELALGTLFCVFLGNARAAAAIVHYRGQDPQDKLINPEVTSYLHTSRRYLDSLKEHVPQKMKQYVQIIQSAFQEQGFGLKNYEFKKDEASLHQNLGKTA
jgi:translation elongation factor EF-1beta